MSAELILAELCICDKHMLEYANEGTCLWCGHGIPVKIHDHAYRLNMVENAAPRWKADTIVPLRRARSHSWDQDSCAAAALAEQERKGRFPNSYHWQAPLLPGEHRPSYAIVRNLFGGWPQFKAYCARVPRQGKAA